MLLFSTVSVTPYAHIHTRARIMRRSSIVDAHNSEHVMPEGVCGVGPETGGGVLSIGLP